MIDMFENKPRKNEQVNTTSGAIAKQRLKNILMRDRVDISNNVIGLVKEDIITVVSDYFRISDTNTEIYLANMRRPHSDEDETVLVCMIPVKGVHHSDM